MFVVIYSFEVLPGQEATFKKAWEDLTRLIYSHEGSLGSRLHHHEDLHYIAYAQWPEKYIWEHSGSHLPESAKAISAEMRASCASIKTLYEMDLVSDLLQSTPSPLPNKG
jgi:heme-degrading monooxygenase HmoA